ncbi:hypothetical protein JCM19233_1048 [Vibrio astriarenae]|nr:hypothetical protein JCM19233_1048 [Vibrio sp. C7]
MSNVNSRLKTGQKIEKAPHYLVSAGLSIFLIKPFLIKPSPSLTDNAV